MNETARQLITALEGGNRLQKNDFLQILTHADAEDVEYAKSHANDLRIKYFGNAIFLRGLVELSNFCKNDCLYCGIRRSNTAVVRYRLSKEQILGCLEQGYAAGLRTLVLQGGEDAWFTDERMCDVRISP